MILKHNPSWSSIDRTGWDVEEQNGMFKDKLGVTWPAIDYKYFMEAEIIA